MPRFLVIESLKEDGASYPMIPILDGEQFVEMARQSLDRIEQIRDELIQIVQNASHRRLLEYNQSSPTSTNNNSDFVDGAQSMESENRPESEYQPQHQSEYQPEYPYLGPLSSALEAIDTKEEVLDLVEDATMDVIHTTFGQIDVASNEWKPPTHAQKSFGQNAWHGLLCMWILFILVLCVGVVYNRARIKWKRTLRSHNKYL